MKYLLFIFNTIFFTIMLGVAGLFLLPYVPVDHGIDLRIVESGSMEPAIMTGAMIVVAPQESYAVGDVIMFESRQARVPTTHRIVEVVEERGQTQYVTKGDANEEADTGMVTARQVIGGVVVDVPRVGFVLDFARQPIGFMLLIVLPALLIVFGEIDKIWRELRARRNRKDDDDQVSGGLKEEELVREPVINHTRRMMDVGTPVRYRVLPTLDLRGVTPYQKSTPRQQWRIFNRHAATTIAVVFSTLVWTSGFLGTTVSYFNDVEASLDNALGAIALDVSAAPAAGIFNHIDGQFDEDTILVTATPEADSAQVKFDVETTILSATTTLCDVLEADAASPLTYTGPLATLSGTDVDLDAPWSIAFTLTDESPLDPAETCEAELELTAWHFDKASGEGYFDKEVIPLMFTYAEVVNSTPPNVAFDGSISDGNNEPPAADSRTGDPGEPSADNEETTGGGQDGGGDSASVGDEQGNDTEGGEEAKEDPQPPTTGGGAGGGGGVSGGSAAVLGVIAQTPPASEELDESEDDEQTEDTEDGEQVKVLEEVVEENTKEKTNEEKEEEISEEQVEAEILRGETKEISQEESDAGGE